MTVAEAIVGVQEGTPEWDKLVAEGRQVVEEKTRRQWRLGELAIVVAGPAKSVEENDGRGGKLAEYADAIGEDYDSMKVYRAVATAWKGYARNTSAPWTCFREIYRLDDRVAIMDGFVDQCTARKVKPTWRRLQEFQGKQPTLQMAKADAAEQIQQAIERMPAEERIGLAQNLMQTASIPTRQAVLRDLVAQPEVLNPVVNERGNGDYMSPVERAVAEAGADHRFRTAMEFQTARERTKEALHQGKLDAPGLTNRRFADTLDNRVRNDALHYRQLADDLREPVLQPLLGLLEFSIVHFDWLIDAAQACKAAIQNAPQPVPADDTIDARSRPVVDRVMLTAEATTVSN